MLNECPVCGEQLTKWVMCQRHWKMVAGNQVRNMLWFLWNDGRPRPGFEDALENIAAQVRDEAIRRNEP